jgi:hypothetical protein
MPGNSAMFEIYRFDHLAGQSSTINECYFFHPYEMTGHVSGCHAIMLAGRYKI